MTNVRARARPRIATALHAVHCGCPDYDATDPDEEDALFGKMADAVLALFDPGEHWCVEGEDEGGPWVMAADDQDEAVALAYRHNGTAIASLKLTLPITPEEPETMPKPEPLTDPELEMCERRWGLSPRPGGRHRCAEFGPHTVHRCCCGDEER